MNKIQFSENDMYHSVLIHGGKTRITKYKTPTPELIEDFKEFFKILDEYESRKKFKLIKRMARKLNMGYKRFKEHKDVVLFYPNDKNEIHIGFFWRFGAIKIPGKESTYDNPVDPFVIEQPHLSIDGTSRVTSKIFSSTKSKCLLFNSIHPKSSRLPPVGNCQQDRNLSDAAHSTTTLFHQIHVILYNLYPFSMFFQVHGKAIGKVNHALIVNCHGNFTTRRKSFPILFGQTLPDYFSEDWCKTFTFSGNIPGEAFGKKLTDGLHDGVFVRRTRCHNSCVQGRHLNGGDQCFIGKRPLGKFIHIELDYKYKSGSRAATKRTDTLAEVLKVTSDKWVRYDDDDHDEFVPKRIKLA